MSYFIPSPQPFVPTRERNFLRSLEVKERPDVGVYVKDLSAFVVNNADDMDRVMTLGNKHRLDMFISLRNPLVYSLT